jgi:hypothetical protein
MGHKTQNTIRVNKTNSMLLSNTLYITLLKASKIASRVLQSYIEYQGNYIIHPSLGKCVQYNGPYSRS